MTSEDTPLPELGWSQIYQSQLSIEDVENLIPFRVTEVHRNALNVVGVSGVDRFPMTGDLADHGVAVGDWIVVDRDTNRPVRVLERKSVLKRLAAGTEPSSQLIAANVDTLLIVSSCNADFNIARLERFLALARQAEIDPVIILTKADLCDDPEAYRQKAEAGMPGVMVETVVATDPDVASRLAPWCSKGQTVALLGSSGVGKTTLINALTGGEELTNDIREDDAKGRHTTTHRSMHRIATGGWLVDTPGMRALRLADVSEGVDMVFQDVADLAEQCRFNDCGHDTEPGCAIQGAIAAGELDADRLTRWQKLRREDLRHTETLAEYHNRTRALTRKYKSGKEQGRMKKGDFYPD